MNCKEELSDIELENAAKEFEEIEKEILEVEGKEAPIVLPNGLDEKMLQMIQEFERIELKKNKHKRNRKYLRLVAMIMVCITATFAIITINVDAFRIKLYDIIGRDHGEYMDIEFVQKGAITPELKEQFPKEWDSVFYPMSLPEGYELVETKSLGTLKYFVFSVAGKDYFATFEYTPIGEWDKAIDSENLEEFKTKVNNKDALCTVKDERNIILWADSGYEFTLITYDLTVEETIKVAESVSYIELK